MYKFSGFTEKANKALNTSISVAENFGHTYIGSEHILLGLLSDSKTVSASLLNSKKITLKKVEEQIKKNIGVGIPTSLSPEDVTPKCRKIIESALNTNIKKSGAGTEQLLYALLKDSNPLVNIENVAIKYTFLAPLFFNSSATSSIDPPDAIISSTMMIFTTTSLTLLQSTKWML